MAPVALALAFLAFQDASAVPLGVFEEACLVTSGDRSAFEQKAVELGAELNVAPGPWFDDAENVTAFSIDGVSVQLETFAAASDWVDAPPVGNDLRTLLQTGRDPRGSIPQVLRTTPATSVCIVRFDQGEGDLKSGLEGVMIDGRALADIGGSLDFQTYTWRVGGPRLVHIQYGRADPKRDAPGTRSALLASFRMPQ